MIRTSLLLSFAMSVAVLPSSLSAESVSASLDDDGHIVLLGDEIWLLGVDFRSDSGSLIPPTSADAADPFDIMMANHTSNVMYGALGGPGVLVDGELKLSVRYNASDGFDLTGQWGTLLDQGYLSFIDVLPGTESASFQSLPEPQSHSLLSVAAVLLLAQCRRSRR